MVWCKNKMGNDTLEKLRHMYIFEINEKLVASNNMFNRYFIIIISLTAHVAIDIFYEQYVHQKVSVKK